MALLKALQKIVRSRDSAVGVSSCVIIMINNAEFLLNGHREQVSHHTTKFLDSYFWMTSCLEKEKFGITT